MANVQQSGSIYIDTTGATIGKRVKVAYIILTSATAADALTLRDGDAGTDPLKLTIKVKDAQDTLFIDMSAKPMIFQDGVYAAITAGATATLVLTDAGS